MDDKDALTRLRSSVYAGDGRGVVAVLRQDPWPADSLQLIGDGLLMAVAQGQDGARALARRCFTALENRRWDGDHELAEALAAALGDGPTPMLRRLPVDLEELAATLEGDPFHGGGRIDLRTGEVWPEPAIEYAADADGVDEDEDEDDDDDRWLWAPSEGSRAGYHDMQRFIDDIDDTDLAGALARAITGHGAFRRFKDQLSQRPELMARWHAFSNDRQLGRARSWLAAHGYTPVRPSR